MSSYLSNLERSFLAYGKELEADYRALRKSDWPQYKYFTAPVYKALVGSVGKVAATAITFFAADLVFHQWLTQGLRCLSSYPLDSLLPDEWRETVSTEGWCKLSYSIPVGLIWGTYAVPVIYVKYRREQERRAETTSHRGGNSTQKKSQGRMQTSLTTEKKELTPRHHKILELCREEKLTTQEIYTKLGEYISMRLLQKNLIDLKTRGLLKKFVRGQSSTWMAV